MIGLLGRLLLGDAWTSLGCWAGLKPAPTDDVGCAPFVVWVVPRRASAPGIPCEIRFALSRLLRFAKGTFAPARMWAGLKPAPTGGGVCVFFVRVFGL